MTLVTAIIPAFNAQATIGATLASVRAQTHAELEIIVVDDGSTDGTRAEVLRHSAVDPRVRLVEQSNGGVAAARNRGIADYVNAMPPRSRKSYKQIFLMLDGTARVADSRTVCEASRACRAIA